MGMFIGASIVTLFEISVFLGKVFWSWVSRKRRNRVVHKVSSISSSMNAASLQHTGMSLVRAADDSPIIGRRIQFWMGDNDVFEDNEPVSPDRKVKDMLVSE